jgi:NAD(P)H-hydrate repair Nnr-like enzyme with NAD(P)H-hydrate dehydratase domain
MDDRTSLFTPHHGEAARLHKQSKSELRQKRRAEWKQLQTPHAAKDQRETRRG